MPLRRGVQMASTVSKNVPMFDPSAAAKVAELIANFYPPSYGKCNCGSNDRWIAAVVEAAKAGRVYTDDATHDEICDSRKPIPFDAMALIEEKCGRYTKGKHKGELRGWASIEVVTEGGWKRHGPGERNGRVVRPGSVLSINIGDDFSGKTYLVVE